MFGILALLGWLESMLIAQLEFWGWEYIPDEIEFAQYVRAMLYLVYYLLVAFRGMYTVTITITL